MSEDLGFRLEQRGDVRVVVWAEPEGGVSPATVVSERLWDALQAAIEREARLRQIAQDDRLSEFKKYHQMRAELARGLLPTRGARAREEQGGR